MAITQGDHHKKCDKADCRCLCDGCADRRAMGSQDLRGIDRRFEQWQRFYAICRARGIEPDARGELVDMILTMLESVIDDVYGEVTE